MGLFDSIQNIIGGAADSVGGITDSVSGSVGDAVGGVTDNPIVQDLQDQATSISDGATGAVDTATEQGQTTIDGVTNNLGL